jgi:hypothetical protein
MVYPTHGTMATGHPGTLYDIPITPNNVPSRYHIYKALSKLIPSIKHWAKTIPRL